MINMETMRTEQNSLGLLEALSEELWGNVNSRMEMSATPAQDVYEIRPREERDGFDLISDRLQDGPIWYAGPDAVRRAVAYAKTALAPARTGRSSACFMKRATSSKRTSTRAISRSDEFLLQCLRQASRRERHFASSTNDDPERVRLKRRVRKIGRRELYLSPLNCLDAQKPLRILFPWRRE